MKLDVRDMRRIVRELLSTLDITSQPPLPKEKEDFLPGLSNNANKNPKSIPARAMPRAKELLQDAGHAANPAAEYQLKKMREHIRTEQSVETSKADHTVSSL